MWNTLVYVHKYIRSYLHIHHHTHTQEWKDQDFRLTRIVRAGLVAHKPTFYLNCFWYSPKREITTSTRLFNTTQIFRCWGFHLMLMSVWQKTSLIVFWENGSFPENYQPSKSVNSLCISKETIAGFVRNIYWCKLPRLRSFVSTAHMKTSRLLWNKIH